MMDRDERELLAASLRKVAEASPPAALPGALEDFGWLEVLADDEWAAVSILFELQGEHLTAATGLDQVVLAALGVASTGTWTATRVILPSGGAPRSVVRSDGARIAAVVDGLVTTVSGRPERVVFPALLDGDPVIVTAAWPDGSVWPDHGQGIDATAGWSHLRATVGLPSAELVRGVEAAQQWVIARAAGQRALAHELVAVARAMLALAVEHAGDRRQFGVPIGSFQAVQHRLADVCLWQHSAECALAEAWDAGDETAAALAKILAGRFALLAAKHGQQVLGGMGFTEEHDFHRYLRRALLLEPLLGGAAELRRELGRALIDAGGTLPRLAPL